MRVILKENETLEIEVSGTDGVFVVSYGGEVKDALTVHSTMPDDDGKDDLLYHASFGESPTDEDCQAAALKDKAVYTEMIAKRQGRNVFRRLSDGKLLLAVPVHGVREGDQMRAYLYGRIMHKVSKYMGAISIYPCYIGRPYKAWVVIHPIFDNLTGMELHVDYADENKEFSIPAGFEYVPGTRDSEVLKQWKVDDAVFDTTNEEGEEEEPVKSEADTYYGQVLKGRNDVYKQVSTDTICWAVYIPKTKSGIAGGKVLEVFEDLKRALSEYFSPKNLAGIGITSEGAMRSGVWIVFTSTSDPHAGLLIQTSLHEDTPVIEKGCVVKRGPKGFKYMQEMSNYDLALMVHCLI